MSDRTPVGARWNNVRVRLYRDEAVVVRQHKLGEADRIITLLTKEHGLVRAVAKGVRRTRSKFGARLEPFAHVDVLLHPGRNLDIVTQVYSLDTRPSSPTTAGTPRPVRSWRPRSVWQVRNGPRRPASRG